MPLSRNEAEDLCRIPKHGDPPARWSSGNGASMRVSFGVVCTPPFQGLLVEIYVASGGRGLSSKMTFTLFEQVAGEGQERVYQLEIAPPALFTHRSSGGQAMSGSHEHVGDDSTSMPAFDDASFEQGLTAFCERIRLTLDGDIANPLEFRLT